MRRILKWITKPAPVQQHRYSALTDEPPPTEPPPKPSDARMAAPKWWK